MSWWYISGIQNIAIPLASSILSDFSLIFWTGKLARGWALRVCEHRLHESFLWYLSVVCSYLSLFCPPPAPVSFFLSLSFSFSFVTAHRHCAVLSFTYILYFALGCLTLKRTSNFESPKTSENMSGHFYVHHDLVTHLKYPNVAGNDVALYFLHKAQKFPYKEQK